MSQTQSIKCKCEHKFVVKPEDCTFVERSTYSEKVTKCPECGNTVCVEIQEDSWIHVNEDNKYYM